MFRYLAEFYLEWEMVQTNFVEEIKHTFYIQECLSKNRLVYAIMWKHVVEPGKGKIKVHSRAGREGPEGD
jgi:uncharacterized protein (DUF1015 family)